MNTTTRETLKIYLYPLVLIKRKCTKFIDRWMSTRNPQRLASRMYKRSMHGKKLDWESPKDLNEKINWLKFNTDLTEWTRLSDKYRVREYVKECGREDLLVKLYGVWEDANDIDFEKLPEKFVLKTNHGCGTVLLVRDKRELNIPKLRKQLNSWLKIKFGVWTVEPQYIDIKPLLIAEEMLENDNPNSTSLVDYKVWCFNGEPYCFMVCANRVIEKGMETSFYDLDWNFIPDLLAGTHKNNRVIIEKPNCLPELIQAARDLSKGHPEVRVDFYIINDQIYFGEMTFTSLGGYMDYISPKYLKEMGALVTLPEKKQ